MYESDYYPAGSYYDPRAPWNEPDPNAYDEQIYEVIDGEMDDLDAWFTEWVGEEILKIECDGKELEEIASSLSEVESIREKYRDYRYENARDAYLSDPSNFEEPEEDYERDE